MDSGNFADIYPHARRAADMHAARATTSGRDHHDDRDDLAQNALIHVWKRIDQFDSTRASLPTFVERVVTSSITSSIRKSQAAKRQTVELSGGLPDPRNFVHETHVRVDVERALDRLRPYDRIVATLLADMTPAEAARALGIARSTIYVVIARIRDAFVAAGLYPLTGSKVSLAKIYSGSRRTLPTTAAYIVTSRTETGESHPTRRSVDRKADMPVGGLS